MSMARRTGTGDPPSVTLSTSMDFLSGLRLPCRLSMGESTRFLGGSAERGQRSQVDDGTTRGQKAVTQILPLVFVLIGRILVVL